MTYMGSRAGLEPRSVDDFESSQLIYGFRFGNTVHELRIMNTPEN
jgi:hypothetical protein